MCLTYTRHEHSKLFVTDYFTPFPRTTLVQKLRPGELLDDKKVKTDPDPLIISYLITKIIVKPRTNIHHTHCYTYTICDS